MHCTSVGKAILAFLPEDRAAEILRRVRFERFTGRTILTMEALRTELDKTKRRGYAVDDEELEEGLRCIAVPVLDAQRQPVAAVSVSGPSFRVTAQKLPSIANHLVQCVRGISMDMGYISGNRAHRTVSHRIEPASGYGSRKAIYNRSEITCVIMAYRSLSGVKPTAYSWYSATRGLARR